MLGIAKRKSLLYYINENDNQYHGSEVIYEMVT